MSNQFMVAAALVDGQVTPTSLHNRKDTRYAEVAEKVKVEIDPDCDKNFPGKESVKLTVRTKGGRSYTIFEEDMGYPDEKFIVDRFVSYGKDILPGEAVSTLVKRIEDIEKLNNIAEIASLLVQQTK